MASERTQAIVYDDGRGLLAPLTDLRASFDVRTGALTTLERLRTALRLEVMRLFVPPELAGVTTEAHPEAVNTPLDPTPPHATATPVLVINGRCPLPLDEISALNAGERLVESDTGDTIAARLSPDDAVRVALGGEVDATAVAYEGRALLARPWHVRSSRDEALETDLGLILAGQSRMAPTGGVTIVPGHELRLHPDARVYPGVTLDLEQGPIVIDAGAVIRPGAVVIGPVYVGRDSQVLDQALIKPQTAIGPVCKVAGEVGGTIFQGHANKAHDGHLGDSWIGAWVNLGAGTTNSNLLNTYGEVSAQRTPAGPREPTGERYLGAIIGDHAKFSIGSMLMTGLVVHTGAMVATSAAVNGCVPGFVWRTDAADSVYRLDKFEHVARTVMGRRDVEPSPAYLARLGQLHAAAAAE